MLIWGTLLALLALAVVALGHWLMQPLWSTPNKVESKITVDPEELRREVTHIIDTFAPRDAFHPQNLQRLADYLAQRFSEAGARVERQHYRIADREYQNVIASYGPLDGARIVIGAHYDTCCEYPGADDNTSGVVGLLALAPWLAHAPLRNRIDLVAFTLEEPPYFRTANMGSAQHAAMLKAQDVDVKLMIALEMIGYFSDAPDSQAYPVPFLKWLYPRTGNYLAVVGRFSDASATRTIKSQLLASTTLPIYSINAPALMPGVDFSDHLNYWQHGFAAVMLTDTAFYRNTHYHTPDDTPEKLDYTRMAEVIRGVYHVIEHYP